MLDVTDLRGLIGARIVVTLRAVTRWQRVDNAGRKPRLFMEADLQRAVGAPDQTAVVRVGGQVQFSFDLWPAFTQAQTILDGFGNTPSDIAVRIDQLTGPHTGGHNITDKMGEHRMNATTSSQCPQCKEDVKPDAVLCKHCQAPIYREQGPHNGTCPYCKEAIHPEATRCKHCRSSLDDGPGGGGPVLEHRRPWFCVYLPDGRQFCVNRGTGDVVILDIATQHARL